MNYLTLLFKRVSSAMDVLDRFSLWSQKFQKCCQRCNKPCVEPLHATHQPSRGRGPLSLTSTFTVDEVFSPESKPSVNVLFITNSSSSEVLCIFRFFSGSELIPRC
ncbi:unnamed protein product [Litomosoides sigmodontis]|uniref:Uncharacterized protein n=1 Tax=Litomosoides sigmodontis TaxID=42156 RepID=A0A3P6UEC2_LITSI|nr:unnamed protein product [Litomosoides sigmodontis]